MEWIARPWLPLSVFRKFLPLRHQLGVESWEVFLTLDDVLEEIAKKSEERLALQGGEG